MPKWLKILIPVVVVLGVAGFAGWWFLLRDDAPPAASLPDRPSSTSTTVPVAGSGTTAAGPSTTAAAATSADGSWTVQPGDGVFAGYRIEELFAGDSIKKTAVGRSPAVTGTVQVDGTSVPQASFTVDTTKLASDSGRRDGFVRGQALETETFPEATFRLT